MGIIMRNGVAYGGGGGDNSTFIGTTAQWEALTTSEKAQYNIVDFTDDYSPGNGFRPLLIIYTDTGSTVTISKTGVSVTAEEVSEGKFVADIPDWGTYTITAVLDSNEITEEIIINTVQIYEVTLGSVIPEGATVTPTDDIQTWLKCANITDKAYTTLAEVLADRSTFETLIADSNACDYMARSTTWASSDGEIPVMTSDTTPNDKGVCIGTTESDPPATSWYKAFDNNVSTSASVNALNGIYYIGYKFETPVVINMFEYMAVNGGGSYLLAFTYKIEGSNDESTWTSLYEGSFTQAEHQATQTTPYIATFNNTIAYKCYRLSSTNSNYNYQSRFVVGTLQFYEADITHNQDAMALIGKYDYACKALLSNSTWFSAINNSDYWEYVSKPLIPDMTGYTTPSGIASASSEYNDAGSKAWCGFSAQNVNWTATQNSSLPQWLAYEFPSPTIITKAKFASYSNRVTTLKIQGSNDDFVSDINDLSDTLNVEQTTTPSIVSLNHNTIPYKKYRFLCLTSSDSGGWRSLRGGSCHCQLYGIMPLKNTYVPLVPTMTSNTTPYGTASGSSINSSNYDFWHAFNPSDLRGWLSSATSPYLFANDYVSYEFPKSVVVEKARFLYKYYSTTNTVSGKFQAYDGSEWVDISNVVTYNTSSSDTYWEVTLNTQGVAYSKYRWICTTQPSNGNSYGVKIQFYGKADQTIIHSAPQDTIYYLYNGLPVVVCTTNSDGIGEFDLDDLEDDTYTFYSSVAKDPNNLSNDFSKAIRITKSQWGGTTELYLMPDAVKTLYWWGYGEAEATASNYRPSWTSVSFVAPTIANNTNDISITQGGNYGSTFFNTPEINSGDITVNVVAKSSSSSGDNLYQLTPAYQNSYTYLSGTNVAIQNTSMTKYSQSYSGTSSRIIPVFQSNNSTVNIYAIWYE